MTAPIDFTQCERLPSRAYNGANGKKLGYVDFFRRHANDLLAPSLARLAPRIDLAAITTFIDGVPCLTDLQRTFYKVYLTARYEALLAQQKVCEHPYFGSAMPTDCDVAEEIGALRHGRSNDFGYN